MRKEENDLIHRGTYDGTIYYNPANKFCIISVKTAEKDVPEEARSIRRRKDHLIRFVATGYELPRTDAVELELDGEWKKESMGCSFRWSSGMKLSLKPRVEWKLSGLWPYQRHWAGARQTDRITLRRGDTGHSAKSPGAAAGDQGHHGEQAGGHQDLICREPDVARPDDAALPVQDYTENSAEDLSVFRPGQRGHFEKESV